MPTCFSCFAIVIALVCLPLGGCADYPPNASAGGSAATDATSALSAEEAGLIDRLVTPATVFPDPLQRARYDALAPVAEDGRRSYGFQLKTLPGMVADRHFHLITISWARAGAPESRAGERQSLTSTGGPNGGFIDVEMRTSDGAFVVRVSEAMRLPAVVEVPNVDLKATAAALVKGYEQAMASR